MGIGDWGIGDWGLGIGPNPQSPIPNEKLMMRIIFLLLINNLNYLNNIILTKSKRINNITSKSLIKIIIQNFWVNIINNIIH